MNRSPRPVRQTTLIAAAMPLAVALLLGLASAGALAGADAGACSAYARQAVNQNNENLQRGCGFGGGRWQSNYDAHYGWCMNGGWMFDGPTNENNARAAELAKCVPKERIDEFCNGYAQTAVRQHTENQQRRCGFSGARWQSDLAAHRNWCMGAGKGAATAEQDARVRDLAGCTTAPQPEDNRVYCSQYARLAIAEQNENIQRGCGYNDGTWHTGYDAHYQWCMHNGRGAADQQHDRRMQQLSHCEPGRSATPGARHAGPQAGRSFDAPKFKGVRVDNCLNWANSCGKPAADYFCQRSGYQRAESFATGHFRPTYVLGDSKVCDEPGCVAFTQIVCK